MQVSTKLSLQQVKAAMRAFGLAESNLCLHIFPRGISITAYPGNPRDKAFLENLVHRDLARRKYDL